MKKLLPLLLAIITVNAFCQTLYVPSGTSGIGSSTNGNVGIGTNAPGAKLDVNGQVRLTDGANAGVLQVDCNVAGAPNACYAVYA